MEKLIKEFKSLVKELGIDDIWTYELNNCNSAEDIKALLKRELDKEYDIVLDYLYSFLNQVEIQMFQRYVISLN